MSASREKKQRQAMAGLSEKEKQAAIDAKKAHRNHILYAVIGIIVVVAVAALLIWDNGIIQRNLTAYSVNGHNYTIADVEYFYYSEYNSYYSTYGTYLFDDDESLKDQVAYTDDDDNEVTWHDLLLEDSLSTLEAMTILYDEAEAAGYTISEDGEAEVQETLETLETYAETYEVTTSYYIQYLYGSYMTESRLEKLLTMYTIASEYSELKSDEFTDAVTEDEIAEYYEENADSLDTYNYHVYYLDGSAEDTTDDDGNTVEATDEEEEAAMEAALEVAEELQAALEDGDDDAVEELVDDDDSIISDYGDYEDTLGSSVSSNYSDFLFDTDTEEGDVEVVEVTTGYYVVQFYSRELDEYHPATYRDIHITAEVDDDADEPTEDQLAEAYETAEALLDEIESEDDFIDLVADNSDDTSTNDSEGLNESDTRSSVPDDNIGAWLFDEERSEGDTAIVEDEDGTGYYILYFVSYDELSYWEQTATSALASDAYDAWYEEVSADVSASTGLGYSLVGG